MSIDDTELSLIFGLPPKDAMEYWQAKISLSPEDFYSLSDDMRAQAFTASGLHNLRDIQAIQDAIGNAIKNGTTIEAFKREIGNLLKGRRWQLETVFRTNIQTAYNVGRYKRQMEIADALPYWQYQAVNDSRTRPTHRALSGKIYRCDHPFWQVWYPPNGYRCRCSVRALSEAEMRGRGLIAETEDPTGDLIEPIDPVTGNRLPARPLIPDPGFATNPGKTAWKPDFTGIRPDLRDRLLKELGNG
jgi:SPP1 gp7 family putative phage head morphogenesis protein